MKPRVALYVLAVALGVWLIIAARELEPQSASADTPTEAPPATTVEVERTLQGRTVDQWHAAAARYLHRTRSLSHALHFDPEVAAAIRLACLVYPGADCSWLWRVAQCESGLWRYSRNRSSGAAGLYQFLPSTWAHTAPGRAGLSVYDPYAAAIGAAQLASAGGRGQWVCQ